MSLQRRLGALAPGAGILAPFIFFIGVGLLGLLEPGYSHLTDPMSLLGGVPGPRGAAFNSVVGGTGLLIFLFALGLWRRLVPGRAARIGTTLLAAGGAGLVGSAFFPCNAGCANVLETLDRTGIFHSLFSLLGGVGTGLATFFLWAAMRYDPVWRRFAPGTFLTAILANGAGVFFWIQLAAGWQMPLVEGLLQRVGIAATLIWMFFIGRVMARLPR